MKPVVEFRTYWNVEVAVITGFDREGKQTTILGFPDEKKVEVRADGYENMDEALAAHVAVWRIRRIRAGIDKPTTTAAKPAELFEEVRTEADSETVLVECGAVGKFGARCYRQHGHEHYDTPHARAHIGRACADDDDAKFIDDGKDDYEIWSAPKPMISGVVH